MIQKRGTCTAPSYVRERGFYPELAKVGRSIYQHL